MNGTLLRITSFMTALIMTFLSLFGSKLTDSYKVASPLAGSSIPGTEAKKADKADFYVSPSGNDGNNGSFSSPFATIERAQRAVRETGRNVKGGITVALMAGE